MSVVGIGEGCGRFTDALDSALSTSGHSLDMKPRARYFLLRQPALHDHSSSDCIEEL